MNPELCTEHMLAFVTPRNGIQGTKQQQQQQKFKGLRMKSCYTLHKSYLRSEKMHFTANLPSCLSHDKQQPH